MDHTISDHMISVGHVVSLVTWMARDQMYDKFIELANDCNYQKSL